MGLTLGGHFTTPTKQTNSHDHRRKTHREKKFGRHVLYLFLKNTDAYCRHLTKNTISQNTDFVKYMMEYMMEHIKAKVSKK
jgi:hypothetical protein